MKYIINILFLCFYILLSFAEGPVLLDKVIAVVGDNAILKSDIEVQYQQYLAQGTDLDEAFKCNILDEQLRQKMLLNQAILDSVVISDDEIESEMDRRLRYFISLIGSEKELEEYYNKSIVEIKDDFKEDIKDQLLSNRMQSKVTGGVNITPSEVRRFFNNIPKDSLPYFNAEFEVGQIAIAPKYNKLQKDLAKEKIEGIKKRILNGEDFATMAVIYSEDPGSASNGGELGFTGRGELVPEFEAVAFSIKPGDISDIVETQFGLHIIQLIERKASKVNVRHILIKPQITSFDVKAAQLKLDSVKELLDNQKITFEDAVSVYSDDEATKNSGGLLTNNQTGTTYFESDQLDPSIYFAIENLKEGEFSNPAPYYTQTGQQAYRILYLKSQTEPHRASLKEDYNKIKAAALDEKKAEAMDNWLNEKKLMTYIHIDPAEAECPLLDKWKSN